MAEVIKDLFSKWNHQSAANYFAQSSTAQKFAENQAVQFKVDILSKMKYLLLILVVATNIHLLKSGTFALKNNCSFVNNA